MSYLCTLPRLRPCTRISNGGTNQVVGCTFYNTGSHGLRISSVGTSYLVASNLFDTIGGYGIANTSGTNMNTVPVPATSVGVTLHDQHAGHIGRGGWCHVPQASHRCSSRRRSRRPR